ncbi:hypothetical protein PsorP6_000709 [Peronosclerospora sorghi]|uniref:Uncharacterized protein n=1 Tax=Peronosclerospora sorghi TaxID=230839 RepID=A0ACC0WZ82_9STRA|nr:hypothetical protein PsorP6_000709 [Peronosclerospora sorghi]
MAVLLTLAVSANNPALSTSVGNQLADVTMDRDTVAQDDGKRLLRVKKRMAETLDEDRMYSGPVTRDFLSRIGTNLIESKIDEIIRGWGFDTQESVQALRNKLNGVNVEDVILKYMAAGSLVAKEYKKREQLASIAHPNIASDLNQLLEHNEELLQRLEVNRAVVLRYAKWIHHEFKRSIIIAPAPPPPLQMEAHPIVASFSLRIWMREGAHDAGTRHTDWMANSDGPTMHIHTVVRDVHEPHVR